MKKFFSAFLSILMVLGMVSCSDAFNSNTYLTLNLGGKAARESDGIPEIAYFDVKIISLEDKAELFSGKFSFGQQARIDGLVPGVIAISIKAVNTDLDIVGKGFKELTLKAGANKTSIVITLYNEMMQAEGELGSESNPVNNLLQLQDLILNHNSPKTLGLFVAYNALSYFPNQNYLYLMEEKSLTVSGGKRVALHFISGEATEQNSKIAMDIAVPVQVKDNSHLYLYNNTNFESLSYSEQSGSKIDDAGILKIEGNASLYVDNVGFLSIHVNNGSLHLNNTPASPYADNSSAPISCNEVYAQTDDLSNYPKIFLSGRNYANITIDNPNTEIILTKDCRKNNLFYLSYGDALDGVSVNYGFNALIDDTLGDAFDLMSESKPGLPIEGLKVNVTSNLPGEVDINEYLFCGPVNSSDFPELYFGKDGTLIRTIASLTDLLSLESGTYYGSRTYCPTESENFTLEGNYTILAKPALTMNLTYRDAKVPSMNSLYSNITDTPITIANGASLIIKDSIIDYSSASTNELRNYFDVKGKLVLDNCQIQTALEYGTVLAINYGSLTLKDTVSNIPVAADETATETVLSGKSYIPGFTPSTKGVLLTLDKDFQLLDNSSTKLSTLLLESGDKLIENKANAKGLAQHFSLYDLMEGFISDLYLQDDGTVTDVVTTYSGLNAALERKQKIIPISVNIETDTKLDPIVIDYNATIAGCPDIKGNLAELNYQMFNQEGPLFTVKNGASLTLDHLVVYDQNDDPYLLGTNEYPLISVEEGGTLTANGSAILKHIISEDASGIAEQKTANLIVVNGKLNLTDGTIISNGLAEGIPQTFAPLIYVAPKGELAASKTSFGCSNNSIYDSYTVYANIIYADGKVTLDNCALSNIEDYTSGSPYLVRYNDTYIPTDTIASAGTNPLILASDTSTVTLNDTRLYGNSVKRATTSDIKRGSFIHTVATGKYHMDNSRATLNLTDVKGYLCNGEYCIVTESPNHTGNYEDHADPLFKVATIKNLSFENCNSKTTYANIYTYGDLYVEGELNLPKGMYFHFYCIGDEYFWYLPKLYKTGTIINTTVNENNESIKIPVDYYYPRAKTSEPSHTKDPYHGKVLTTPSSDIKIEDGEIFNLFAMNRNDYAVDVDGYVSYVLTSASASNIGYAVPASTVNYWTLADNVTVDNTISIPSSRTEEQISVATTDPVKLTLKASPAFKYEGSYYFALKGKNKNFSIVAQDDNDNTSIVEVNSDYSSSTLYLSDVILGSSDKKATGLVLNKGNVVAENSDFLSSLKTGIIVQPENPDSSSLTFKGDIGLNQIEICGICPINLTEANIVDPSFHLPSSLTFIISEELLSAQNGTLTLPISGLKDKIEQCTFLTSENEAATIKNVTDTSVTLSLN